MQTHQKSSNILRKSISLVDLRFPDFSRNKKQEIVRLVFEISKRDKTLPRHALDDVEIDDFGAIKEQLLKKRYPVAYRSSSNVEVYLSRISLKPQNAARIKSSKFYPKQILVEKDVQRSDLVSRFKKRFPKVRISYISSLTEYLKTQTRLKISDYNKRLNTIFITEERYDLFKKCPCTKKAIGCGYHIFNLGFGCIFECTYCYLQEYTNVPGITFPAKLNRFFDNFTFYRQKGMRIGTGEFSDSLALDDITGYSHQLIDFFNKHTDVLFEFKTKSANIKNLLSKKNSGNIIVSWSLNPQNIIDENEFFTASLNQRLHSAARCIKAGYKVGFHFDPVFYYSRWQSAYAHLIERLFTKIEPKDIIWISIGTFRFAPALKKIIEERFPRNKILDAELIFGFDRKLRYPDKIRYSIYQSLIAMLKQHNRKLPIYLCMEKKSMWQELNLPFPF